MQAIKQIRQIRTWGMALMLLLPLIASCPCFAAPGDDIVVKVEKDGEEVIVDLSFTLPVTPQEAWGVLVDYEHMPQFLGNLKYSKILERSGDKMKVAQKGETSRGPMTFAFESIREVELTPYSKIYSHLISGTMKKLEGITLLNPSAEGTRVEYHSVSIPNMWMPPIIGTSIVETEIRKQFQDMRAEIMRRKAVANPRNTQ